MRASLIVQPVWFNPKGVACFDKFKACIPISARYCGLPFHCVVPENIHISTPPPPPPPPTEGAFALDLSLPWNFHSRGTCHTPPPTPWNFRNFSAWLGTVWKENLCKKVVALYVYAKDNFFCDEMSKNVFIMNSRTFLANN